MLIILATMAAAVGAWLFWRGAKLAFRLWKLRLAAKSALALIAGAAYTISPVDMLPDMLFGIGWLDDLVVIALAIVYVRSLWTRVRGARRPVPASHATVEVIPQISARY